MNEPETNVEPRRTTEAAAVMEAKETNMVDGRMKKRNTQGGWKSELTENLQPAGMQS